MMFIRDCCRTNNNRNEIIRELNVLNILSSLSENIAAACRGNENTIEHISASGKGE
jgi:hypothetical protein